MRPLLLLLCALAAAPAAAATPDYVTIAHDVVVDRPVAKVWARIGGWCAIADWLKVTCETTSGAGEVGSVRRLNGTTLEAMVAKTATSYTYWQTAGAMGAAAFHGTLAAQPEGKGKTRLTYTVFYDAALLPSDAERAAQRKRLDTRFVEPLAEMKKLAEAQ
jgi:hypothetical protein